MSKVKDFFNNICERIKKAFQHKGKHIHEHSDTYAKYLTKRSYKMMGFTNIIEKDGYATVIDKKKNEYFVISIRLRKPNGINEEIENNNYNQVEDVKSHIESKVKTIILSGNTNRLKDNIEYAEMLYENETDPFIKEDIYERLMYLKQLNTYGEIQEYQFIEEINMENALQRIGTIYFYKVLDKKEIQSLFLRLHNE